MAKILAGLYLLVATAVLLAKMVELYGPTQVLMVGGILLAIAAAVVSVVVLGGFDD